MNFWIVSVVLWFLLGTIPWEKPPRWATLIFIVGLVMLIAAGVQIWIEMLLDPNLR